MAADCGRPEEATVMADVTSQAARPGFSRTCWRGIRIAHPSDWEPAYLSRLNEPMQCRFVDRRFERLQVTWQVLPREPDLPEMYRRLARHEGRKPSPALKGVPEWTGLVRHEGAGAVVHAGRFFRPGRWLVQVVMVWPEARDRELERAVFEGISPQPAGQVRDWEALGLSAAVPADFDLTEAGSKVGKVAWDFKRPKRRWAGLSIERLAMPEAWLKGPLGEWLAGEIPPGFRPRRETPVDCGGQGGTEIYSRRASPVTFLLRTGMSRLDRAWLCRNEARVYRVAYWDRAAGQIDWPAGLEVHCCQGVRLGGRAR